MADLRLSETSAALRTEFTFAAAPAAEPTAEPTADRPPDPPASPKRSYEEVNGPVPTGPVIDENGLAQQVREEPDEPLRGQPPRPREACGNSPRGSRSAREAAALCAAVQDRGGVRLRLRGGFGGRTRHGGSGPACFPSPSSTPSGEPEGRDVDPPLRRAG